MEQNETRAFYRAIADFSAVKRELKSYRKELAETKAAEEAYNATSGKKNSQTSQSSKANSAALDKQVESTKAATTEAKKNTKAQVGLAAAIKLTNRALQSQNKILSTNASRFAKATLAAQAYRKSQKDLSATPTAGGESAQVRTLASETKAIDSVIAARARNVKAAESESVYVKRAGKAHVQFVEDVGKVNTATGEVVESTEKATESVKSWTNVLSSAKQAVSSYVADTDRIANARKALVRAREAEVDAATRVQIAEMNLNNALSRHGKDSAQALAAELRLITARRNQARATDRSSEALARFRQEASAANRAQRTLTSSSSTLLNKFQQFGNWRPRLVPPFVALIPIIGAVVAAMNPLVALIGTLGPMVLGLASNIGSLAGAFLALPGILSGVVAGIASVIASFGGVGSVFKAYGAMNKAINSAGGGTGSSGGGSNGSLSAGPSAEDRAYDQARAEYNLAKAHRSVQKAQENLNKARQEALKDLQELRLEVSRADMNEERAVANLQQAKEALWRVLADPGSTKGDKMDAAADLKEAEQDLADVRKKNAQNAKDLQVAEKKGIEGSDRVKDAKEDLTDAIWSERDAQRALKKQLEDTGSTTQKLGTTAIPAAVSATNEFNDALAKLSPSAQKFVWAIIGMQDQWEAFKRTIQEAFFSEFVDSLDRLPQALKNIQNFLLPAATSMGKFVDNALRLFTSSEWNSDIIEIGKQNGIVLDAMGRAVLALADALKDIVIAAGPFTDWLVNSLADGAENFRDLVDSARETGSLANWLSKVSDRLEQWWRIVKNVGSALFNYSAAASEFGQWLTDNLEEMTASWADNAKAARKEGSPFQQWLEDIKPLLSEVNGLLGDFFGWFAKQAMDPKNIEDARELISLIRTDLGPAVGRLLEAMAELDIDEKFIEALSAIVDAVTEIITAGGGAGFEAFFDVLVSFFEAIAEFLGNLTPGQVATLGKLLGTFAALSFIGKFTGITTLLTSLTGFLGSAMFSKFLSFVSGTERLGKAGKGAKGGGFFSGLFGGGAKAGAEGSAKGGWLSKIGAGAGKGVLKGGIAGIITGIIGELALSAVNENTGDTTGGAWARKGAGIGVGALSGAGVGAAVGSVVPGIGTAIGAGVGAVAGGIGGAFNGNAGDWTKIGDSIKSNVIDPIGRFFSETLPKWWSGLVDGVGKFFTEDIPNWWTTMVDGVVKFFTEDLPYNLGYVAGVAAKWLLEDFPAWLASIADGFWNWLTVDMPAWVATAANKVWTWLTVDVPKWVATAANRVWTWLTVDVPKWVGTAATRVWTWLTVDVPKWVGTAATRIWTWLTVDVPRWVGTAATKVWTWLTVDVPKWVGDAGDAVWTWLTVDVPKWVSDAAGAVSKFVTEDIPEFFKGIPGKIEEAFKQSSLYSFFSGFSDGFNGSGKELHEGRRGDVPYRGGSTLNRVKSLLPAASGLGVTSTYRTPAQNRAVGGSATSLHMDRNNPAVDIAGPAQAMWRFAVLLGRIGGWRQLYFNPASGMPGVGYWPGHSDHIHVANKGGLVPGQGNGDGKKPFRLTPGEFVLRKEVVRAVGAENISRLNSGVATWQDMLLAGAQRSLDGQSSSISTGGAQGLQNLVSGQGLQGSLPKVGSLSGMRVSNIGGTTNNSRSDDYSVNVDKVIVQAAPNERAEDSMPRAIRKLGYMNLARSPK